VKIALDRKATEVGCFLPAVIQLRTPLTRYATHDGIPWVLDNGCFTEFKEDTWLRMVMQGINDNDMLWFTMPDEVANHRITLNLFERYKEALSTIMSWDVFKDKAAFVLQDGCNINEIPWDDITAIFLGGSTKFKLSREAYQMLQAGRERGKWVHVGRVNTTPRIVYFSRVANSIDGSGIAKYDWMLDNAIELIDGLNKYPQSTLFEEDYGWMHNYENA